MRHIIRIIFCATTFLLYSMNQAVASICATELLPDGGFYTVGLDKGALVLERHDAQGMLCHAVGNNFGGCAVEEATLAVQVDGKIVVAARVQTGDGIAVAVARYLPTTLTLDSSFGHQGMLLLSSMRYADAHHAISILPDGGIVVAGIVTMLHGSCPSLTRLQPDGQIDINFGDFGSLLLDVSHEQLLGIVTKVLHGQLYVYVMSSARAGSSTIVRVLSDGSLDATFATDGKLVVAIDRAMQSTGVFDVSALGAVTVAATYNKDLCLYHYAPQGNVMSLAMVDRSPLRRIVDCVGMCDDECMVMALDHQDRVIACTVNQHGALHTIDDSLGALQLYARYRTPETIAEKKSRAVLRAPTGPLTIEKIFCYEGCNPVVMGFRDGVRVMITKEDGVVLEEPFCTLDVNEVFVSPMTESEFDALSGDCSAACQGDAVTICDGFEQTWTLIASIEQELSDKFYQTWTMLAPLDLINVVTLMITITTDLSPIFTAIVQSTDILSEKFQETWTMIAHLDETVDLSGFYTAIAGYTAMMCDKFEQTWTMLDALDQQITQGFQATWTELDELETTVCMKFAQVFTDLDTIEALVKIITTSQLQEFAASVSILDKVAHELLGTLTQLEAIVFQIDQTFTVLEALLIEKFNETWTAIEALNQDMMDGFAGTWTMLQACCDGIEENQMELFCREIDLFQGTYSMISALALCDATPITGPTTIVNPGTYCLANDISDTTMPTPIIIQASNVILDLNGHTVTRTTTGDVISVAAGFSNITIKNGNVVGTVAATNAVHLSNVTNSTIDSLNISSSIGILVDTATSRFVKISNCDIVGGTTPTTGVSIANASEGVIKNCLVRGFATAGISLNSSTSYMIAGTTSTSNTSGGILLTSCSNCTVDSCIISNQTAGDGIAFATSATDIIIKNCTIDGNVGASSQGIDAAATTGLYVIGNTINNNEGGGIAVALGSVDIVISGNTISANGTGNTNHGISFAGTNCERIAIENNLITKNAGDGINGTMLSAAVKNNQIAGDGTSATANQTIGINLGASSQAVCIENNCISRHSSIGIQVVGLLGGTINGNEISNNLGSGMSFVTNASRSIALKDNTIVSNGGSGIVFSTTDHSEFSISDNTISDHTTNGISVGSTLNNSLIKGNHISGNSGGGTSTQVVGISIAAGTKLCVVENCITAHLSSGITTTGTVTSSVLQGNSCIFNGASGMVFGSGTSNCTIAYNICSNNTGSGISISTGDDNNLTGNICNRNTVNGIVSTGATTDNCSFVANRAHQNTTANYTASPVIPFQSTYVVSTAMFTASASAEVDNMSITP